MGPLHLFCALPCSLRIALPPLRLAPVLPLRRPSLPPVTPPSLLLPQGGLWNYSWRTGLDASGQPVHNSSEAAPAALPLPWAQQLVPSNSAKSAAEPWRERVSALASLLPHSSSSRVAVYRHLWSNGPKECLGAAYSNRDAPGTCLAAAQTSSRFP